MSKDSKLRHRIKRHITRFASRLTQGWDKVVGRFVREMIYGIQASRDIKVSNVARALNEDIRLIKTENRLCRNLAARDLTGPINASLCWEGAGSVQQDTFLAVDIGDVPKEYAEQMEYLARVRDGSTGQIVHGYWPQVARSGSGLIGYLHVPEGNAADAPTLVGAVKGWAQATGRVPELVSTDDGYTSAEGPRRLEEMGVETVSFSGSKGRRLLGEWDWWDEERMRARQERPAVESVMFTLKYSYCFGRLSRRGIEAVRAELWEDVVAYNFFRMVQLERRAASEKVPRAA